MAMAPEVHESPAPSPAPLARTTATPVMTLCSFPLSLGAGSHRGHTGVSRRHAPPRLRPRQPPQHPECVLLVHRLLQDQPVHSLVGVRTYYVQGGGGGGVGAALRPIVCPSGHGGCRSRAYYVLGSLCPIYLDRTYYVVYLLCMLLARQSGPTVCPHQAARTHTLILLCCVQLRPPSAAMWGSRQGTHHNRVGSDDKIRGLRVRLEGAGMPSLPEGCPV